MRKLAFVLALTFLPAAAFARGDSHMGHFGLSGFYGLGSPNPTDINGLSSGIGSSPKVSNINASNFYGGALNFMMGWRWDVKFMYDQQEAKNYTDTNLNANTGFDVTENNVWGVLDYYLIHNRTAYVTLGAGVGYPTAFKATEQTTTTTDYTAAAQMNYIGQATIGIMLMRHLSIFFEGGYQKVVSGNVTDPSNAILKNASGQNAVIDLSGFRGDAGVKLHF